MLEDQVPRNKKGAESARSEEDHPRRAFSLSRPLQLLVPAPYVLGCT